MKAIKRVGMFLFNWVMLLTMPVWGGFVLWGAIFADCRENGLSRTEWANALLGKKNMFTIE